MKSYTFTAACLIALASLAVSGATHAQSTAQVNVTGRITSGCSVNSSGVTIPLGNVSAGALPSIGDHSPTSPTQNITITCPADPTGIVMKMTGKSVNGRQDVLELTNAGASGVANGVGVQLIYDNKPLVLNSDVAIPIAARQIPIAAHYIRLGTLSPGTADTTATLNFTFN